MSLTRRLLIPGVTALISLPGLGDEIQLRGGEKLIGSVVSTNATSIEFESQTVGRIRVPAHQVEQMHLGPAAVVKSPPRESEAPVRAPEAPSPGFATPNPGLGKDPFDWVELKSGEWLKGEMKSLQNDVLEFDSEELDEQVFDWKDIRTLRSVRLLGVRFDEGRPLNGSILVTTNEVVVFQGGETQIQARSNLFTITPTGSREWDKWSGKVMAGVSFRSGNTKGVDYNAQMGVQRRSPGTRVGVEYLGNYGRVNGVETENNHRITGKGDYFISRRLFVRVPDTEYYRDRQQNIDHRLTLGGGAGYDLVKTARVEWSTTIGPAWQANWFDSVESSAAAYASSLALVLSTKLDLELTRRLDFVVEYRGQLTSSETGNNVHHSATTLEFEIRKSLKFDCSFVWDRITSPKAESDGATPTPDDFRLITSLGIEF